MKKHWAMGLAAVLLLSFTFIWGGCGKASGQGKNEGLKESGSGTIEGEGEKEATEDEEQEQPDIAQIEAESTMALENPPSLGLQTIQGEETSCTFATLGTYQWTYTDANGVAQSVMACGAAPTDWEEIASISYEKTGGRLELIFNGEVKEYTVNYWMDGATCGVADPVETEGNVILLPDELYKGVYEVHVVYENGDGYYGFRLE